MTTTQTALAILAPFISIACVILGAFLKFLFDRRQGRVQSVSVNLRITPLELKPAVLPSEVNTTITVEARLSGPIEIDRLYVVRLIIQNTADKDFDEFSFGLTYPRDLYLLAESSSTPDHQHTIVDTEKQRREQDIVAWIRLDMQHDYQSRNYQIKPFTRKDRFTFRYTFAPLTTTAGHESDGAGGWSDWVRFTPSGGQITRRNLIVGTPIAGVRVIDARNATESRQRRLRVVRPVAGIFALGFLFMAWFQQAITGVMGIYFGPLFLIFGVGTILGIGFLTTIEVTSVVQSLRWTEPDGD